MARIIGFTISLCLSVIAYGVTKHYVPEADPIALLHQYFTGTMHEIGEILDR